MNIQRTAVGRDTISALELLEYNDYHFFRYTVIIVTLLPVAVYAAINLNSTLGASLTIILLLWEALLLIFSALDYNAGTNLPLVLHYRVVQFWLYRALTVVWMGLFIWAVVIMLSR